MSGERDKICQRLLRRLRIRVTQPTLQRSVKPLVHIDDLVATPFKETRVRTRTAEVRDQGNTTSALPCSDRLDPTPLGIVRPSNSDPRLAVEEDRLLRLGRRQRNLAVEGVKAL
jgi:hypothetical protein